MTSFHRYLGTVLVLLFAIISVAGLVLRVTGRRSTPTWLWGMQHWSENLVVVQLVGGVVLLLIGRRVPALPFSWFHYLYGSLFPLIALIAGRLAALRREAYEYVGLAWGAFVAFALVLRAAQTGCGALDLVTCLVR